MSFVGRARSSVERGDTLRAVLTLVAGLRRTPRDAEALELLVELVRDQLDSTGIEHEIIQVLVPQRDAERLLGEMVLGLQEREHDRIADRLLSEGEKRGLRVVPPAGESSDDELEDSEPAIARPEPESSGDPSDASDASDSAEVTLAPEASEEPTGDAVVSRKSSGVNKPKSAPKQTKRQRLAAAERAAERAATRRRRMMIAVVVAVVVGLAVVGVYGVGAARRGSALTDLDTALQSFDRFDPAALDAVTSASASRAEPSFSERVTFASALAGERVEVRLDGWQTAWGLAASAISALRGDDLESALAIVTKAERTQPGGLAADIGRALLEERRGNFEEARAAATRVLDKYPRFAPGHEVLIRLAARQLEFDAMDAAIGSLKTRSPDHPYGAMPPLPHPRDVLLGPRVAPTGALVDEESDDPFLGACAAYRRSAEAADSASAAAEARAALAFDARFVPARLVLAAALAEMGDLEGAVVEFKVAAADAHSAPLRVLIQAGATYALVGAGRPDLAAPFSTPFPKLRGEGVDDRFDDEVGADRPETLRKSALTDLGAVPWAAEALYARVELHAANGDAALARALLDELRSRNIAPGRAQAVRHWLSVRTALGEGAASGSESDALVAAMNDWWAGRHAAVTQLLIADSPAWWAPIAMHLQVTSYLALGAPAEALALLDNPAVGRVHRTRLRGLHLRALARMGRKNAEYVELRAALSDPMPTSILRRLDLADAALYQGDFADAEAWLERARKLEPQEREAAWICGLAGFARNRDEDAAACFERSGRSLESAGLLVERGVLALEFGRPKQAEDLLARGFAINPASSLAARQLALAINEIGGKAADSKIAALLSGAQKASGAVQRELLVALAIARGVRSGEPAGLEALDAATAVMSTESAAILVERANYHVAREEWGPAGELYTRAIRLNPRMADAHLAAAKLKLRVGDKDNARSHLQRVIELDPQGASSAWARRQLE